MTTWLDRLIQLAILITLTVLVVMVSMSIRQGNDVLRIDMPEPPTPTTVEMVT